MATLLPRWCLNPSDGLRRWQATNGVTTTYVLDLQPELATVLQASDPSGTTSYLYGLGDSPLVGDDGATWRYLSGRDALNSVRQETDAAGQVLAVRRYDPYGVPITGDGGQPYGYSGEWWDAETELVYLRARYLRPELAVFLTKDSWPGDVRQPGTLNGYAYSYNNPLRYTDPTGRFSEDQLVGWYGENWRDQFDESWQQLLLMGELGDAVYYAGAADNAQLAVFALQGSGLAMWDLGSRSARSVSDIASAYDKDRLSLYRSIRANPHGGPSSLPYGDASPPEHALWDNSNLYARVLAASPARRQGPASLRLPDTWYRGSGSYVTACQLWSLDLGADDYMALGFEALVTAHAIQKGAALGQAALKGAGGLLGVIELAVDLAIWARVDTSYAIVNGPGFGPARPAPTPRRP